MKPYTEDYLQFMMTPPETGVAFNDNIYLLQQKHEVNNDSPDDVEQRWWISATKCSFDGTKIKGLTVVDVSKRADPDMGSIPSNPVACVHQGVLHVFWRQNGVITYRESMDGKNWGKTKTIGSSQLDKDAGSIAVVSTGDALVVFIPYQKKLHIAINKGK